MNKTKKYLLPCLAYYGEDFARRVGTVFKLAVGIGDVITVKSNILFEKHIFLLVDSNINPISFNSFKEWIKDQPMYEDDYAFDNILTGHLHVFVISLPEQYYKTYETFKESQYSKMYNPEEINHFIKNQDVKKVLIKDNNYIFDFTQQLNETFGLNLTPNDINDGRELDLPILIEEEYLNSHLRELQE